MRSLYFSTCSETAEWVVNQFRFVDNLTDKLAIEFQRRNPQLQSLKFQRESRIRPSVWYNVANRTINIAELRVSHSSRFDGHMNIAHMCIPYISTLQHLRKLDLCGAYLSMKMSFFSY